MKRSALQTLPNGFGYARGNIAVAVAELATGPGDVRRRLGDVYDRWLHVLVAADFPIALRSRFTEIERALTRYEPDELSKRFGRTAVQETLRRIHNSTGSKIAKMLVELSDEMNTLWEQSLSAA